MSIPKRGSSRRGEMSRARRAARNRNAFVNRQLRGIEWAKKKAQRPGPHAPPDGTCIVRKVVARPSSGFVEMSCGHVEERNDGKRVGDMARCLACSWERHRQKTSGKPRYCLCAVGADLEDGAECPACGGTVG